MKQLIPFILLASGFAVPLSAQSVVEPDRVIENKAGASGIKDWIEERLWNRLDLSEDQKEKLKQIREADRDNLRSAWAQVKIARESLKATLLANPENSAEVQAKATAVANALSASSVQTALHLAKIGQVLTPAQRVELDELRERWKTHCWGRRGGERHRSGGESERGWQRQEQQAPEQAPESAPQPVTEG